MCACVSENEREADRRSRSNCVRLRELKKASRFASWSQRRATLLGGKSRTVYEERRRRCCYSPFSFFFFPSLEERAHTHTRPPEAAKPSWERSNSGGLSPPLCPSPARYPGNGSTSRTSFVESTRHSSIHSCLPSSFYIWRGFLFSPLLCSPARERANFIRQDSPYQSVVSFAEMFSQLPLDYLGFLIIHRLSLSFAQSSKCTRDYLFHWKSSTQFYQSVSRSVTPPNQFWRRVRGEEKEETHVISISN